MRCDSQRRSDATGRHSMEMEVGAPRFQLRAFEARPHSDVFGHRYEFNVTDGDTLANTQAAFYWGTTLVITLLLHQVMTWHTMPQSVQQSKIQRQL